MKKTIGVAFGFVGTVIGAGFASGKEVMLYFSDCGILSPFLAALLLGLFAYLFCEIGRITNGDGFALFGKGKLLLSCFIKGAAVLVFCTTIAGCEEVFYTLFGFHGGAIITVIISLIALFAHKSVTSLISVLSVLAIVILLILILSRSQVTFPQGKFSPLSSFLYAGMNMLTGGFFISAKTSSFTKKESFVTAVISFLLLSSMLLTVFLLCEMSASAVFPVLAAAEKIGLGTVGAVILYLAMYTTSIGTLSVAAEKKLYVALLICSLALTVACFGFETLIKKIYPAIGTAGCVITVLVIGLLVYKRNKRKNDNSSLLTP